MNVVKNIMGEDYTFVKTQNNSPGFVSSDSKGVQIFRKRDNYYMGHFRNISDFVDQRKRFAGIRK